LNRVEHQALDTEILVVGGGAAGLNAALSARAAGCEVTVMDKAVIERSGHFAGGIDHFAAYLETGPQWDTRAAYLAHTAASARGAADIRVVERVYCDELAAALARFEAIGCRLARPDGSYFRTRSYGQPGPWWINFDGKRLKPLLAAAVRRAGCRVLDRVVAADLLTRDGTVCGAAGFHLRSGAFFTVRAKAVLVATGGTNRLFQNPSGLSFNCWMCPADTGDGEAMAFRAGARLANMEYLRLTIVPRGFSAAGLNALVGMGGRLVNGLGEAFMESYDPAGMNAPRYQLVEAVIAELKAHRGPVWIDCRHLAPEALQHLVATLGTDKDTLPDFFAQKGVDLGRDLLEIAPSEGMQGSPNELCGSGLKIGPGCETSLPGLYGAGNSADQCRSLHMAFTSGIRAGRSMAAFAAAQPRRPAAPPEGQLARIRERLYAPMLSTRRVDWRELEDVLQRTLTEGLGPARSAWGLRKAAERLNTLEGWLGELRAETFHDLCRAQEVFNMLTVGRCMAAAALARRESRFGICHRRLDFPATDDRNFLGQIAVFRGESGAAATEFVPLP
jgi:adenylylsulfate reductase subunit A